MKLSLVLLKVFLDESAKSIETPEKFILKRQLTRTANAFLSGVGIVLLMNASIIFWESFLLDVSYTCDDAIDCFAYDNIPDYSSRTLITTNCSSHNRNKEIACYKFKLAFVKGLAAFGGLMTFIQIIVKITTKSSIWISSRLRHKVFQRFRSHTRYPFVLMLISIFIIMFATSVYTSYFIALNYKKEQYFLLFHVVRFMINVGIAVFCLWTPWFLVTETVETDEERGGDTEQQDSDSGLRQSLVTPVTDYGTL